MTAQSAAGQAWLSATSASQLAPGPRRCPATARPRRSAASKVAVLSARAAAALSSTTSRRGLRSSPPAARAASGRSRPVRRRAGRPAAAGRRPSFGGIQLEGDHAPILQVAHPVRAAGGQFVQPAVAVHDKGRLPAQLAQHFGQRVGQGRVVHADQLVGGAGRVGQRAEQVEDGALAQFSARPDRHASSPGETCGANMKPMPTCSMQVGHLLGRQIQVDAQRAQHVGAAAAATMQPGCRAWPPCARPRR